METSQCKPQISYEQTIDVQTHNTNTFNLSVRVIICIVSIEYWLVSKNRWNHNELLKTDATQYMILPQIRVSFPKLNDTIVDKGTSQDRHILL